MSTLTNIPFLVLYLIAIVIITFLIKNNFLFFFVALELLFLAINLLWILYSLNAQEINGEAIALFLIALAAIDAAIGLSLLLKYFAISLTGKVEISQVIQLKG